MTQRHRRLPSDASALSFAVIYDPVNGLQSFIEPVLSAYDESDGSATLNQKGQGGNIAGLHLEPLDLKKRNSFTLFNRRGPEKHVLNIRTSSLYEKGARGQGMRASSPAQSEFSVSIYSQESGTDESAGTYIPPAPISLQAPTTDSPPAETKTTLRPKLRFNIPSLYAKVSFYRNKPAPTKATTPTVKPDVSVHVSISSPHPEPTNTYTSPEAECSAGPRLYSLLHKVHNASCSGASCCMTERAACCGVAGDARVPYVIHDGVHTADDTSERWRPSQDDAKGDCGYDGIQADYDHQIWPDFEYDPRLPSRFSVTTTSTSRYIEINKEALSFSSDSTRYYSAPFDDVPVFEPPSSSLASSPFGTPKRLRNPWRPRF